MAEETDFDFDSYRTLLTERAVEGVRERMDGHGLDAHDALSEVAFEVTDEWLAHDADTNDTLAVLQRSPNDPVEFQPYIEGKDDWEAIMQGIAFTVVRQDLYDALEAEGYLDDHWNATDKLTEGE